MTIIGRGSEDEDLEEFTQTVWSYYDQHGRHDLPWRQSEPATQKGARPEDSILDPYKILVSELMLQQTQVNRVIPKYADFLERFPTVQALAQASLGEVLTAWQGLGYNRRAKFLWQAAQMVANEYGGDFPRDQKELTKLPGVGQNTAGAIMVYAYDRPAIFLETNIRTVYIHHFFADQTGVDDKDIAQLVRRTLPADNVRQWYWALMDYGTYIKQIYGNKSRAAKGYAKQSPFQGSKRQVRGVVIRYLSQRPGTLQEINEHQPDIRLTEVIGDLEREGLVREEQGYYRLA